MLQFFKMAEATRNPLYKDIPLTVLMEDAAERAGWHLEYVPNLQSKTKYQVKYEQKFDSQVVAELACRLRKPIENFLYKRDIDPSTIDSHVGYGFFNFIKTYKPEVHDTDEKICAAIYRSVMNKVDQGNRKETFRYRPTEQADKAQAGVKVEVKINDQGEEVETQLSVKYVKTPREISLNMEVEGKGGDQGGELGDFIPDNRYSADRLAMDRAEEEEIYEEYSSTKVQKLLLQILMEAGAHGKMTSRELQREAMNDPDIIDEVTQELEDQFYKKPEYAVGIYITEEMVNNRIARETKVFYKNLKERLAAKLTNKD